MVDPADLVAVDDLRAVLRRAVHTGRDHGRAARRAARRAQQARRRGAVRRPDRGRGLIADQQDLASLRAVVEEAPIVKFVNLVILQAVQERASDIHVEPTEHDLRIRFRIDGVLHERMRQPRSIIPGVISRLKVMADIDIAERRVPKDGRIGLSVEGKAIDLRVSTLPTVYGEKIVMRILDRASGVQPLDGPRLPARAARRSTGSAYEQALRRHPRHRPDRLRQVDDALRHAQPAQRPDAQHRDGRGSGRVPPRQRQPGADEPEGRAHVRLRRCARSCARTPTSCSSARSATGRPASSPSRPP